MIHSPFKRPVSKIKVRNKDKEADVLLYDEIGFFGVNAKDFESQFNAIDADTINLRIYSPGGDVFEGVAIANTVARSKSKVIVHVDSLAASIASYIAMFGDEVRIAKNARMMVHDPWGISIGGSEEMRKYADLLDGIGDTIADAYMEKSGKDKKEIFKAMADETWFTAKEAVEFGLADSIEGETEIEDKFDLSVFNNVPDDLKSPVSITTRLLEAALRDAGCSKSEAKAILHHGFRSLPDADNDLPDAGNGLDELAKKWLGAFS